MHNCENYHYGNQQIVRTCCVEACCESHRVAKKVALTVHHPAYQRAINEWNSLSTAECSQVMDILESEGFNILISDAAAGSLDELNMGVAGSRMYPMI